MYNVVGDEWLWKGGAYVSMDKVEATPLTLRRPLSTPLTMLRTLTDRLSDLYGISGQAQIWFSSYLKDRHQSVKIKDTI